MNDEHTKKLLNDFPEFFKHRNNPQESLMIFGFECRDGWFDLIYNLCKDIKEYYLTEYNNGDEFYHCIPDDFYVVQVKEKFGGLRYYITAAPEYVHNLIHDAENKSFYVCEHCGKENPEYKKGDKRYKGFYRDKLPWILTLCDDCLRVHLEKKGLPFKDYVSPWQKENKAPFKIIKQGDGGE